jgi:hypothetical protein
LAHAAGSRVDAALIISECSNGSFVNFEAPGTLGSGWYLTFRNTDPATLAYVTPASANSAALVAAFSTTGGSSSTLSTVARRR